MATRFASVVKATIASGLNAFKAARSRTEAAEIGADARCQASVAIESIDAAQRHSVVEVVDPLVAGALESERDDVVPLLHPIIAQQTGDALGATGGEGRKDEGNPHASRRRGADRATRVWPDPPDKSLCA